MCREGWDEVELLQLEAEGDDLFSERGEVVLVGVADPLDQAVNTKAFDGP